MTLKSRSIAIASLVSLLGSAQAQTAAPPSSAAASAPAALPEIRVRSAAEQETATGPAAGYAARRSATATKTDTPLAETPQAITVVTRKRVEELGAANVQDALNYAAGVRSDAYGLDTRSDGMSIRGGFPDVYQDGLRQNFNYYTSTARTDPYILERLEVLRGPAAMLFGQGSTAGIVNLVSKRPLAEAEREVGVVLGSFGRKQLQTDLTGPLSADGQWLYRVIALGRDADTQVDHVRDDRKLLAPSLTWKPSGATTWTLQARWQDDKSGSALQFFPWSGSGAPNPNGRIPTSRFIGELDDRYDTERSELGWVFEHRFSDDVTARQTLRATRNRVDYASLYADAFSVPGDSYIDPAQRLLDRYAFAERRKVDMLAADQHVEAKLRSGTLEHRVLAGLDALRYRERSASAFDSPTQYGGGVPPIDVYAPVYTGYTVPAPTDDPRTWQRQFGLYLQDQLRFGSWIAVAGARHDRVSNGVQGSDDRDDSATTKRVGVMYLADNGWSPYVSYSESFQPVPGANLAGELFVPIRGKQFEVGVKRDGGGHSFTAALFDLRERNRVVTSPVNPNDQVQAGKTRARGLELELVGRVLPQLDVSAHYNYLDFETDDSAAFDPVPEHQAAVWGQYRFALGSVTGLSAGLGLRWFSSFRDGAAPRVPELSLVDAALAWDRGAWRYALNVQNLADKSYVSTCLERGDCFYGARRTVSASATYRF
jgi:iron complex outermembrane receptor protein